MGKERVSPLRESRRKQIWDFKLMRAGIYGGRSPGEDCGTDRGDEPEPPILIVPANIPSLHPAVAQVHARDAHCQQWEGDELPRAQLPLQEERAEARSGQNLHLIRHLRRRRRHRSRAELQQFSELTDSACGSVSGGSSARLKGDGVETRRSIEIQPGLEREERRREQERRGGGDSDTETCGNGKRTQ